MAFSLDVSVSSVAEAECSSPDVCGAQYAGFRSPCQPVFGWLRRAARKTWNSSP